MLNNLSEKYKFYVLLSATMVTLFVCYQLAFKTTMHLWQNYKTLTEKATSATQIPKKTAMISRQLTELNTRFFGGEKENEDNHEMILERVGRLAARSNVLLVDYPPEHMSNAASVQVETHTVVLKGNFKDLLEVMYELETKHPIGRIASAGFYTETDRNTKKRKLFLRMYIQNFRNLKSHE